MSAEPLCFRAADITGAIKHLKNGKAVPDNSLPAEVWKLCADAFADLLTAQLNVTARSTRPFPEEVTNCALALLPKPNKPGRSPADLRPLGLQDPSSKIIATVVREQLLDSTSEYLQARPQYAYTPGKAIDEAIARVSQHCRIIRERVQSSVQSVHDRRAKRPVLPCVGGIMLGLDLSRAFDQVPRPSLAHSLRNAGAPEAIINAVMHLHNACQYEVRHKGCTGKFAMQKGVRQGCTLSPCLYAIFSCLLYDVLAARTCPQWAAKAITLFADDSHLAWEVNSVADLQFVKHCIQQTFQVFREHGMSVHPEKSQLVLRVRGRAAANWIKQRQYRTPKGKFLDLGTPHAPIHIPVVSRMVYLGVVVSYGAFEQQTCLHRVKAASQNRHRLAKLLHCRRLSLRQRARLYVARVRSCLLYGQHAVGVNGAVLRKLDQFDARALRALSRAPAHLTRESTGKLRRRLEVESPLNVLNQTLTKRISKLRDESICQWFTQVQANLSTHLQTPATACSLEPIDADIELGVACPECGLYFPNHRHVQSHRARQHGYQGGNARAKPGVLSAVRYVSGSVGGMPECRHCRKVFTRVEGLKKHLKSGCPAVHAAGLHSETAAGLSGRSPTLRWGCLGAGPHKRSPRAQSLKPQNPRVLGVSCRTLNSRLLPKRTGKPSCATKSMSMC